MFRIVLKLSDTQIVLVAQYSSDQARCMIMVYSDFLF